jgi:secreted trypsin-like serine protease
MVVDGKVRPFIINKDVNMIDWKNFNSSLVIEVTRPQGIFTCSGVAISKDTILTAAHCLEGEILKVRIFCDSTYDPKSKSYHIESFELHPRYNSKHSNYKFDVAKIKLKKHLPSEVNIYPMMKNLKDISGKILRLGFGERNSINARTLVTPFLKEIQEENGILELHDMYSYSGDSGGPIFVLNNGQISIAAIHSTLSYGSQGKFSFNPLLPSYRDWILAPCHRHQMSA